MERRLAMERTLVCLSLITLLGATLASCGKGQPRLRNWEALDLEATHQRIAEPTAVIDADLLQDVVRNAVKDLVYPAVRDMAGQLRRVFPEFVGRAGDFATDQAPLSIEGAQAFLKISCPGPDLSAPDTSFEHGFVRIDAPDIDSKSIKEGDLQLTFSECGVGEAWLDGISSAFYSLERGGLLIDLRLDARVKGVEPSLDVEALISSAGLEVAIDVGQLGSVVLSLQGLPDTIKVRAANLTFTCSISSNEASCAAGDNQVTFPLDAF